tara:strand:+ start:26858 stop:27043 length:186 start_codon:yes stop_codon:yes gene_type:complete
MFAAIKLAMQYKDSLPLAVDLIQEIELSMRDDFSISQKERSKLMSRFWALVKSIQTAKKAA